MIKLSDRLQVIADKLEDIKTMADIGTDHGFLPVYMVESGRCEFAVAADISEPSLAKARALISETGVNVDARAGDGLAVIQPGEVEAVVIAGMGGTLMTEIMGAHMDVVTSLQKLVLQPRTASGELRKWLIDKGFAILAEDTVVEGKFIPVIITCTPPGVALREGQENLANMGVAGERELFYEVPTWMSRAGGPVKEHVSRILRRERNVWQGIQSAKEVDEQLAADKAEEVAYLERLIESGGLNE